MKYVRTKDGRIVEECNLEPGFKQTSITIIRKNDNKVLRQLICDDLDNYLEMVVVGEYCKCNKINPKDIRYETTVLNDILKQAETIEELCDEYVVCLFGNPQTVTKNLLEIQHFIANQKLIGNDKNVDVYGAIWTEWGLKYVAKMNKKGEFELL